jgi:hypothetical protein
MTQMKPPPENPGRFTLQASASVPVAQHEYQTRGLSL